MDAQTDQMPPASGPDELELYVLRSDHQRAVNRLDQMRIEINRLRAELERRPRDPVDLETLRKDTELLTARLKETEERCIASEERLAAMSRQQDELQRVVQQKDDLVRQSEDLRAERNALRTQVETLENSLHTEAQRADLLRSDQDLLRRDLAKHKAELAERDARHNTLRAERDALQHEIAMRVQAQSGVHAERDSLRAERDVVKAERDHVRAELSNFRGEHEIARRAAEQTIEHLRQAQIDAFAKFAEFQQDKKLIDYMLQLTSGLLAQRQLADQDRVRRGAEGELVIERQALVTMQNAGHQILQGLEVQQHQFTDLIQGRMTDLAATLQQKISDLELKQLASTQVYANRLNAGLLSKFAMIASEVNSLRRLREGGLPVRGNGEHLRLLYLDLLEQSLTGYLYDDPPMDPWSTGYDPEARVRGWDWPGHAHTMIGRARLRNIRELAEYVFRRDIKGDFLEAGIWRGGACIYMRGLLAAYDIPNRRVWAADSFQGLPEGSPDQFPADAGDPHHTFRELAVTLDEVKENFSRYNLLDDRVVFLPGWFKDTLPLAPVDQLAILRLDGDMYESTMDTLNALYERVAPGGFVIIDDYILNPCHEAVHDFRDKNKIEDAIREVDGAAVYWQVGSAKRRGAAKRRRAKAEKAAHGG